MVDDRYLVVALAALLHALDTLTRIRPGLLVGALGQTDGLQADGEARRIHHDEHALQPAVLLADQISDRSRAVATGQDASGCGVQAELAFDRHRSQVVVLAQGAVVAHETLGHDEQRNALGALQAIAAICRAGGARAHRRKIRARLRLGQHHNARPLAADQARQVAPLLLGRADVAQHVHRSA